MGRRELADGVAGDEVRLDAPRPYETEQRDLDSEQRGLGPAGLVQQGGLVRAVGREQHLAQGAVEQRVEVGEDRVEGLGEHREALVEFAPHGGALAALAGEEHRGPAAPGRLALDHPGVGAVGGQCGEGTQQPGAVPGEHGGPLVEPGAGGGEGERPVQQVEFGMRLHVGEQA